MGEEIKVFDLEECKDCPFKELELITNYFSDNQLNYDTAAVQCINYDSCNWLKNKLVGSN